jgi:23S rRNA (guanosine2251-2'-O)-methyltransferase
LKEFGQGVATGKREMDNLYGIHSVLECLKSGTRPIDRIYFAQGITHRPLQELIDLAKENGVPYKFEPRSALDRKSEGMAHQGVVAVCSSRSLCDLDDLLDTPARQTLFVVLDSIEDPRNLGAILRSCAAFNVQGVLVPKDHSAGLSPVVAKTAEGGLEHLKISRVTNLARSLEALKKAGFWVVGIESGQGQSLAEIDLTGPVALVLGNEGKGIRRLVREHCDFLAEIPARGPIHSLNVSVAAGIALYEVARQRAGREK